MGIVFEWDPVKASFNLRRHGVSFAEASTVFGDPMARIFADEDHSAGEEREIIIGHSFGGRLLVVSFTARASSLRLFSARPATRHERQDYEEGVGR